MSGGLFRTREDTGGGWWRGALALPAGVLAVHQLRYVLAYGAGAGHELRAHGDTYVGSAVPVVALLLAVASIGALLRFATAWRDGEQVPAKRRRWWSMWLTTMLVLLAGFCLLELLEVAAEAQHPGLASIFGDGGWWALPAAASVAALLTLVVRGGRALLRLIAGGRRHAVRAGSPSGLARSHLRARLDVLASCAAGRAPPGVW
jgi:hypothetical protein